MSSHAHPPIDTLFLIHTACVGLYLLYCHLGHTQPSILSVVVTVLAYSALYIQSKRQEQVAKAAQALAAPALHPFSLQIVDVRQNANGVTEYKIEGNYHGSLWSAWRRFSELRQLKRRTNEQLARLFPDKSSVTQIVSGSDKQFAFIDERRRALNVFLKQAVKDEAAFELLADVPAARHALGVPDAIKVESSAGVSLDVALKEGLTAVQMGVDIAKHSLSKAGGDGWTFHSSSSDGISCFLKQDGDKTYAMGRGPMDYDKLKVGEFLLNLEHRPVWDDLWKRTTQLEEFKKFDGTPLPQTASAEFDVLALGVANTAFKSPAKAFVAERDTSAVFIAVQRKSDGAVVVALRSIEHPKAPEGLDGYIRAKIVCAAFVMEDKPDKSKGCIMTTMGMVDPNGAIPKFVINAVAPTRAFAIRDINNGMRKVGFV